MTRYRPEAMDPIPLGAIYRPETHPLYLVEGVGDGDTLTALVDLGADVLRRFRIRLTVVDCPERGDPGWAEAREFSTRWVDAHHDALGVALQVRSSGRYVETFGRFLGDVYDLDTGESLSAALLQHGHAVVWED